jgi:hypothetical protein
MFQPTSPLLDPPAIANSAAAATAATNVLLIPPPRAARLRSTVIADFRPEEVIAGTRKGLN